MFSGGVAWGDGLLALGFVILATVIVLAMYIRSDAD